MQTQNISLHHYQSRGRKEVRYFTLIQRTHVDGQRSIHCTEIDMCTVKSSSLYPSKATFNCYFLESYTARKFNCHQGYSKKLDLN